ncbi:MAG: response regulator [Candidatus Nealsonbacteria bacterium]|nr:response regulator [Candidatus Nealsonbacteria bacterium]
MLIAPDPAAHAEFRGMICADGRASGAGRRGLPAVLAGIEVDAVVDGRQGIAYVSESVRQNHSYLAAVIDMDGGGGVETARQLLREDPDLPLLFSTSGDRSEITRHFHGSDRFLLAATPWDAETLSRLVAIQVDRRLHHRHSDKLANSLDTTRRQLEEACDKVIVADRVKNEFMSNVTHEIRTPMNAILGFTRLLMKEPLDEGQAEKLQYVDEAGKALMRLIDNMLDFSKLAAGALKLKTEAFHLETLVAEVVGLTRDEAYEKRLAVQYNVVGAAPRWLRGDRIRFRQILVGLVENAIKFTEQGTIHIQIALDEQTDNTAGLRVTTTDTGVGIPAERQAIIFDAFEQADGSSTRQVGGLGLGLSICKQLVDLMGGQIGFRSNPGQGSSFWLTLTFEKHDAPEPDVQPDVPSSAIVPLPCGEPRVLVADDDQLSRTLAEMLLSRAGCLVDLASDGSEALAMFERNRYGLVLMDVDMPVMDGLTAIEEIRRHEADVGGHVGVIALTAMCSDDARSRCLAAGADQYISKPFTPEVLIEAVQRYFPGCLEALESAGGSARPELRGGRPDPPHTLEHYLKAIYEALEEEDFVVLENSAGALRHLSLRTGSQPAADHAMRVQLAARSSDLKQVAAAVWKLEAALEDVSTVTAGSDPVGTIAPKGAFCRENSDR